jgi:hypothetical protein
MAVTVNASTSSGLVWSSDLTGAMELQTNGTVVASTATNGNFAFNSGYGSAATVYGCRAWANFNGVTTVTIAASGGVSSITRNSTGNYTVNFSTTMPATNYSVVGSAPGDNTQPYVFSPSALTTTTFVITTTRTALAYTDPSLCCFAVFR